MDRPWIRVDTRIRRMDTPIRRIHGYMDTPACPWCIRGIGQIRPLCQSDTSDTGVPTVYLWGGGVLGSIRVDTQWILMDTRVSTDTPRIPMDTSA